MNRRHGHSSGDGRRQTPTYQTWSRMITRCSNPKTDRWPRYGGRGIKVCERWRLFDNFLADMGERPLGPTKFCLDRIDNNKDYEPSNCQWTTALDSMSNTRRTRRLTALGKTQTLSQWSREQGIRVGTIWQRLVVYKWPEEKALTVPVGKIHEEK